MPRPTLALDFLLAAPSGTEDSRAAAGSGGGRTVKPRRIPFSSSEDVGWNRARVLPALWTILGPDSAALLEKGMEPLYGQ